MQINETLILLYFIEMLQYGIILPYLKLSYLIAKPI